MKHIVKGSPMCDGGRATAQEIGACGRYAVGLFRGFSVTDEVGNSLPAQREDYIPFPPNTIIALTDFSA